MKTQDAQTRYVSKVLSLVSSGKITADDADEIFTAVRHYIDSRHQETMEVIDNFYKKLDGESI